MNAAPYIFSAGPRLIGLEGYKAVGGMRASLYNAMPEAGVKARFAFIRDFEGIYG
jgi:phosphoserine aminotransferase